MSTPLSLSPPSLFIFSVSSRERQLRSLPDVAPNGFGTTVVLENDPHTFALVHWSGLPKKVEHTHTHTEQFSVYMFLHYERERGIFLMKIISSCLFVSCFVLYYYYKVDHFLTPFNLQRIFILTRDRDTDGSSRESYLWM